MLLFIGLGAQEVLVLVLGFFLVPIFPLWTIFKKSGQNPWLSLLALVPGFGVLVALYIAAFSDWRKVE
jgi:branched-subunit amino acid transport protein AzlD